mgnify:CR=1 FL=1|jgi:hypothetical protein
MSRYAQQNDSGSFVSVLLSGNSDKLKYINDSLMGFLTSAKHSRQDSRLLPKYVRLDL